MTKETKTCPYCGEEILLKAKKCKYCGEFLEEVSTAVNNGMKKCPYCAELIPINTTYCNICETLLNSTDVNVIPKIEYTNSIKNSLVNNGEEPNNLKQWNWGAFWFSWIWGIANKSYMTFWVLIPFFGFIWMFVCGTKGNEWAWQNKNWNSVDEFNNVQKKWSIAGNSIAITLVILSALLFIAISTTDNNKEMQEQTIIEESNYNNEDNYDYDPDPYEGVEIKTYNFKGIDVEYNAKEEQLSDVTSVSEKCYNEGNTTSENLNQCVGIKLHRF